MLTRPTTSAIAKTALKAVFMAPTPKSKRGEKHAPREGLTTSLPREMTCGSTQSGGCNKNPASFPAGQVRGLREQRELRTADRVLILRQRSASGKTPGGPATASAKKARRMAGGQVCLSDRQKSGPSPTCLATSCPVNSPKMGSAIGRVQKENAAAVPLARCAVVRRRCALGHRRAANFCANQCGVQSAARRMPFTLCPAAAAPPSHEKAPPARVSRRGSALL